MLPIDKPGKLHEPRPISLKNVLARTMEKLVLCRLGPWIESILPAAQAGFRKYRSCKEQVSGFTEDIAQAMYGKKVGLALFLDYSGAYDRVHIKALLAKLGTHSCPPQLLLWLRGFLLDRIAYCRWGEHRSKQRVIPPGLPQRSSLSCLLWDVYVLGLPSKLSKGEISLLADDTMVWTVANNYQECLPVIQEVVQVIESYCADLWITINPSKTVPLPFGNKKWDPPNISVSICEKIVQGSRSGKYLGVTIDTKLTFQSHVQSVSEKYLRRCRLLASLSGRSWVANESTLHLICTALLEPIINYACAAWAPHFSESNIMKAERVRKVGLRIQTGCCKYPVEAVSGN